jgi:predicted patatin/cPLA2 family phospholipase
MPLVSNIVDADGYRMLDGGIVDPVPYRYMEELGCDRNVYILTQPKGFEKKPSSALPLIRVALRRTPKIVEAMEVRHEVYNRQMAQINEKEARGEILVIRPPESLGISRTEHDPNELERVYQTGRREAYRMLPKIRAFLKE